MMQSWSSFALPALLFSSGLFHMFPRFLALLREPGSKFKQKVPLVELCSKFLLFLSFSSPFASSAWWSAPQTLSPYFLFDILVPCFFLTAVHPLLSDGLFCCLKHLIGGQVYIIRGESQSPSCPWSAALLKFPCPCMLSWWMDTTVFFISTMAKSLVVLIANFNKSKCLCFYVNIKPFSKLQKQHRKKKNIENLEN